MKLLVLALSSQYNVNMATKQPFNVQLRRAVEQSDLTRYKISKRTGIAQSILSRFINQGAGLSMASIDKLIDCLGLRLVDENVSKRKKGR